MRLVFGAVLIAAVGEPARAQCETQKLLPSGGVPDSTVDIGDDVAIVGGFLANAAYIYRFNGSDWVEEAVLEAADAGPNALFGSAVAIDGDVAVVGASGQHDNVGFAAGAAYVFRYQPLAGTWVQEAKLLASDGAAADRFGWAVAVSGQVIVAGAFGQDSAKSTNGGAAYVFRSDGSRWVEEAQLVASVNTTGSNLEGWSVSIDGNLAVVGAPGGGSSGQAPGAAYVYRFDGSAWMEEAELINPEGASDDSFGSSVAASGEAVVVGSYGDDDNGGHSGSAFVFRHCGIWELEAHVLASDGAPSQVFGASVSIDGDVVVVGAPGDGDNGLLSGSAYFYRYDFDSAGWRQEAKLLASDGNAYDSLGRSVALHGDSAILGADSEAYVFAGLRGTDCNGTGAPDACDLDAGRSEDADGNGVPDECDCPWDLDGSGVAGVIDLLSLLGLWGSEPFGPPDFDGDGAVGVTDLLALLANWGPCPLYADCNGNGVFDLIEVLGGASPDCDGNGVPDECDIAAGTSADCNGNGVPDGCDVLACASVDCNENGIPDECELAAGSSHDCNGNGALDECDLEADTSADCNGNGIPDECDVSGGASRDANRNGLPDECETAGDDCQGAVAITDGATQFFTFKASSAGPPVDCGGGSADPIDNDVWFIYTATCTGTVTFSVCNAADFDAAIAVYAGTCPSPGQVNALACSDDAPGCGQTPVVQVLFVEGFPLLVRVGSSAGAEGVGILTVSCEPLP